MSGSVLRKIPPIHVGPPPTAGMFTSTNILKKLRAGKSDAGPPPGTIDCTWPRHAGAAGVRLPAETNTVPGATEGAGGTPCAGLPDWPTWLVQPGWPVL